ncbi:MAG: bifunctional precorrin-2 dehydrogenase/sirohydrochlorin ferrochelatase [Actinomycetota bacterium]
MSEHDHYVACLDLRGRRVLVVGDSQHKVDALRAAGADVLVTDRYEPEQLDGVWLVIVVDVSQGERVYADATERRVFCNVEDVPERCSFILPALHRRGPITLAVSTSGASPALAQHLRDRFARQIGFEHEQLAYELKRIRPWVKQNFHTYAERREYFRDRVEKALSR